MEFGVLIWVFTLGENGLLGVNVLPLKLSFRVAVFTFPPDVQDRVAPLKAIVEMGVILISVRLLILYCLVTKFEAFAMFTKGEAMTKRHRALGVVDGHFDARFDSLFGPLPEPRTHPSPFDSFNGLCKIGWRCSQKPNGFNQVGFSRAVRSDQDIQGA